MKPEEAKSYVLGKFKDFSCYIEIADFKTFLILALTRISGQKQFLQQIMGQNGNPTIWFYDEVQKVYFIEMGIKELGISPIILYHRSDKQVDFVLKGDNKIFQETLNKHELELLVKSKMIVHSPTVVDFGRDLFFSKDIGYKPVMTVNSIYKKLEEFIVSPAILSYFFILESESGPDVVFDIKDPIGVQNTMTIVQPFDVFLDEEKSLRNNTYVLLDQDLKSTLISELKMDKGDLFEKNLTLIVKVKSFKIF
jgi:hypothetical protein